MGPRQTNGSRRHPTTGSAPSARPPCQWHALSTVSGSPTRSTFEGDPVTRWRRNLGVNSNASVHLGDAESPVMLEGEVVVDAASDELAFVVVERAHAKYGWGSFDQYRVEVCAFIPHRAIAWNGLLENAMQFTLPECRNARNAPGGGRDRARLRLRRGRACGPGNAPSSARYSRKPNSRRATCVLWPPPPPSVSRFHCVRDGATVTVDAAAGRAPRGTWHPGPSRRWPTSSRRRRAAS